MKFLIQCTNRFTREVKRHYLTSETRGEAEKEIAEWNKNNPRFTFELVKEVRQGPKGDRT